MDIAEDEQRFTDLYREHYSAVDAFVRRRVRADQVTDLVAETFLVAWRRLDELPRSAVLPWLYGVAKYTLANAYRSEERRLRLVESLASQPQAVVGDHSEEVVHRASVAAAFDELSDADQEVLRLTLWEDLTASQAAKVMRCSVATFQVRLHRARKRLRGALVPVSADRGHAQFTGSRQTNGRKRGGGDA